MKTLRWRDNPRAFEAAYNRERRATAKAAGLCQTCVTAKARIKDGKQLARCQACEDDR